MKRTKLRSMGMVIEALYDREALKEERRLKSFKMDVTFMVLFCLVYASSFLG